MKCNHDCFNCPFPDCIEDSKVDESDEAFCIEYKKMCKAEKKENRKEYYKARKRIYARKRYIEKAEQIKAYQNNYYHTHREEVLQKVRDKRAKEKMNR